MEKREDLRVVKTKRAIRAALVALLSRKRFAAVTVADIIGEALVNRTTFYKHYDSKYDLASQIADDFMAEFDSALDATFANAGGEALPMEDMERVYDVLYAHKGAVLGLWDVHEDEVDLHAAMCDALASRFAGFAAERMGEAGKSELLCRIFVSTTMTAYKYALESGRRYTAAEVAAEMSRYLKAIAGMTAR